MDTQCLFHTGLRGEESVLVCAAISRESQELMIALHSCTKAKEFKAISQNQKHRLVCHSIPVFKIMMHSAKNIATFLWGVILVISTPLHPKKLDGSLTAFN